MNAAFFYATINLYDRKESRMRLSDGCPLVFMKEGGAYEHNGSSHIVVTYIYSTVLHRQPQKEISIPTAQGMLLISLFQYQN